MMSELSTDVQRLPAKLANRTAIHCLQEHSRLASLESCWGASRLCWRIPLGRRRWVPAPFP